MSNLCEKRLKDIATENLNWYIRKSVVLVLFLLQTKNIQFSRPVHISASNHQPLINKITFTYKQTVQMLDLVRHGMSLSHLSLFVPLDISPMFWSKYPLYQIRRGARREERGESWTFILHWAIYLCVLLTYESYVLWYSHIIEPITSTSTRSSMILN